MYYNYFASWFMHKNIASVILEIFRLFVSFLHFVGLLVFISLA